MSEQNIVDVPIALRELIMSNEQRLREHQAELTAQVQRANIEMMQILNLKPEEGWRLDIARMAYVKLTPEETLQAVG